MRNLTAFALLAIIGLTAAFLFFAYVAKSKNRNPATWGIFGFVNVFAVMGLLFTLNFVGPVSANQLIEDLVSFSALAGCILYLVVLGILRIHLPALCPRCSEELTDEEAEQLRCPSCADLRPYEFLKGNGKYTKIMHWVYAALGYEALALFIFLLFGYTTLHIAITTVLAASLITAIVLVTNALSNQTTALAPQHSIAKGIFSLVVGGVLVGLLTGMVAPAGFVFGTGFGLSMGHAPPGYVYKVGGTSSEYSLMAPAYAVMGSLACFGMAVMLGAAAFRPFGRIVSRLNRGEAWSLAYFLTIVSCFVTGVVLSIWKVIPWLFYSSF
jgi:hypothetical protein